jgi:hypothetical protein
VLSSTINLLLTINGLILPSYCEDREGNWIIDFTGLYLIQFP